jgi:DNA-binding NarL/FixJ family response regulator
MEIVSSGGTRPRFLIADDHAIFADTLRVYLEKTYTVIGLVQEGRGMVAEAIRLRPDVVLTDIGMPLLNGLDGGQENQRNHAPR